MKLLLFDVDQTLISTGGAGIRALNRAFQELFSVQNAMEGILPHGKTDPGIIREIFSTRAADYARDGYPTSLEPILDSYLTFLQEEVETSSAYKILPGILHVLDF